MFSCVCFFLLFAKVNSTCLNTNRADGDVATKVYLLCHYIFPHISWPLVSSLTNTHTATSQSLLSGRNIYSKQKLRYEQRMEWPIDPNVKTKKCVQKIKKIKHIDISITFSVFVQTTADKLGPENERGRWKIIRNGNQPGY